MKSKNVESRDRPWCQAVLIVGLLLAGCKTSEPDGSEDVDHAYGPGWSAVHADSRNSDYSPILGPRKVALAWQRKFDGTINLGPTIGNQGHVYLTTNAGECHLYALDAQTGNAIWCTREVNQFAVASSALVDGQGRLYIADNEAMHAFDAAGNLLWETKIKGFPLSAQFTHTGRLVFITHIGIIYVLDRSNGAFMLAPPPFPLNCRRTRILTHGLACAAQPIAPVQTRWPWIRKPAGSFSPTGLPARRKPA